MTDEEALSFLNEYLRDPTREKPQHDRADLNIEDVAWALMVKHERALQAQRHRMHTERIEKLTEWFGIAAWQLARLGILRPGERWCRGQPGAIWWYTLTDYGRAWLSRPLDEGVFASPDRSAQLGIVVDSGTLFMLRGIEAGECYRSGLYLACVAMCGAAREAVLVALAQESMSASEVEKLYLSTGGRGRLESRVVGNLKEGVRTSFKELSSSLDFWRDYAAHGRPAPGGEPEPFRVLQVLLRLAQFVDAHITQVGQGDDTPSH